MHIVSGTADALSPALLDEMAHYRYCVFVERLGWQLQADGKKEWDQFDREDTLYIMARGSRPALRGVARMLPTSSAYLLDEVFPALLGGRPAPHSARIWELSRFAAIDLGKASHEPRTAFGAADEALALLDCAMSLAVAADVAEFVTVSPVGVERLLKHAGMVVHRFAPALWIEGELLCAYTIELLPSMHRRAARRLAACAR